MSQDITHFLDRALKLVANGYRIIPVRPGEKRPGIAEWQHVQATVGMAKQWASNGYANGNIGILTAHNPAIDLDIYDADMAEKMQVWCLNEFGAAPIRIGRAPKRLLIYYANTPFRKLQATYADQRGTRHKVEVLGDGQQFVAYGIHPDTKQPFNWITADQPLVVPYDMLPALNLDQARAMLTQYGQFAKAANWLHINDNLHTATTHSDALLSLKPRLKISKQEVINALDCVDGAEDYDRWLMVGMALHHQSQGHAAGLALWHEWSAHAPNYDHDALNARWASFSTTPDTAAVTFASVLKLAHARQRALKTDDFARLLNVLRTSTSEADIFGPIAKQLTAAVEGNWQLDIVAKKMQERIFEITEVRPRIETVRKALVAAQSKGDLLDRKEMPAWCNGWVYLKKGDRFYHIETKSELTERGFNAIYDRDVLTIEDRMLGVAIPKSRAASLALNIYNIPTVDHTIYLPGMNKLVEINGRMYANTFDETSVPPAKEPKTKDEHAALAVVQNHFEVLFSDPLERNIVLDYLAYNVQFPTEKIVWGIIMQGTEGAGKTFIVKMMSRVLGPTNVGSVNPSELSDRFTGWAEDHKLIFVEEIRLHGANRYEVLDKLKPYVSNEEVTIRKMQTDSYEIPNVANYIMFTNYWDALPINRMDRRYYVVATSFQTKEDIDEWGLQYPNYFANLFDAAREHSDIIRHWLLTRSLSSSFQPKRPALDSTAKFKMRDQSDSSDEADALMDVLEASTDPEISSQLLNANKLKIAMENAGALAPYGRAFSTLLTKAGFHLIGRFRIESDKPKVRFYTQHPRLFRKYAELTTIREIQETPHELEFQRD